MYKVFCLSFLFTSGQTDCKCNVITARICCMRPCTLHSSPHFLMLFIVYGIISECTFRYYCSELKILTLNQSVKLSTAKQKFDCHSAVVCLAPLDTTLLCYDKLIKLHNLSSQQKFLHTFCTIGAY